MSNQIALVIPTIREKQIKEFLVSWKSQLKEAHVSVYLVEDNKEKTFQLPKDLPFTLNHLSWVDAPENLLNCITVKSPASRQIGFWKAYSENHDVILTLDDDTRPEGDDNFFLEFSKCLIDGVPAWVDPLLNYRSRGYPEKNTGNLPVDCHIGSFNHIPDVDGDTQLRFEKDFASNPPQYVSRPTIVPEGQYVSLNGGICGFKRDLIPYVHYALWSEDLNYFRFDDIWMGVILKKTLDLAGRRMSYGPPYVKHIRASDAKENASLEKEGKVWNESFWEVLNEKLSNIERQSSIESAFEVVSDALASIDNAWSRNEAKAMMSWRSIFK